MSAIAGKWPPDWWSHIQSALWVVMLGGWFCCGASSVHAQSAQQEDKENAVVVTKEVRGKISAVSPQFITIEYNADSTKGVSNEIYLTLGDQVELRHKQRLNELKYGDAVKVTYEEKQRTVEKPDQDGRLKRETQVLSRQATAITFLKPAQTGLVSRD